MEEFEGEGEEEPCGGAGALCPEVESEGRITISSAPAWPLRLPWGATSLGSNPPQVTPVTSGTSPCPQAWEEKSTTRLPPS